MLNTFLWTTPWRPDDPSHALNEFLTILKVLLHLKPGKRVEHQGIRVEFLGHIVLNMERTKETEFISLAQEVAYPGELTESAEFEFEFRNVEKLYESYHGRSVTLRYFIRVTVQRKLSNVVAEKEIWVLSYNDVPEIASTISMEVGIENALHIEFEYSKSKFVLGLSIVVPFTYVAIPGINSVML